MNRLTDEQVADLKAKFPGAELHSFDDEEIALHIVFRGPNWSDWSGYKRDLAASESRPQVMKAMVAKHLVYPSPAEFESFLERSPASVDIVMGEIGEVAGMRTKGVRRKL